MPDVMYTFGRFRLDIRSERLWCDQAEVVLAPKVFALLKHLASRPGKLVTRGELLEAIWPETHVDDHTISVHVRELRRALGDEAKHSSYIETRHRRGYVFIADIREAQGAATLAAAAGTSAPTTSVTATRYARSGDVNIAYQVIGDGPLDLVFVMGWVSHLEYFWREPSFAAFLRRLASFSRLILFDKRGTGLSDRVPVNGLPTLEERMDDVRAVLDAVGSRKAIMCGVSEGGPLSAVFAATYPERTLALVMIGSYARRLRDDDYPWGPTVEEHERFLTTIENEWGGPVGLEERAPSMANDPAFRQWWAEYLRMGASPGAAVALTRMNAQVDIRPILPTVRVPALVLHQTGDRCLLVQGGRYLASKLPNSRMVELPGADHLPFTGDQQSMLDEIQRFIAGVGEAIEVDGVLATILVADFNQMPERLASRLVREAEWFRGYACARSEKQWVATFDGPARAIRCAIAWRDHARELGAGMHAGIHTGECFHSKTAPAGSAVQLAIGLAKDAKEGETLTTPTTRDLAAGAGVSFYRAHEDDVVLRVTG